MSFRVKVVEADSVADYLARYYKPSRMTTTMLQTYLEEYATNGFVCTSHFDNVTGDFICWPYPPDWAVQYVE